MEFTKLFTKETHDWYEPEEECVICNAHGKKGDMTVIGDDLLANGPPIHMRRVCDDCVELHDDEVWVLVEEEFYELH